MVFIVMQLIYHANNFSLGRSSVRSVDRLAFIGMSTILK